MTVYAETQDIISYMKIVQNFDANPASYEPIPMMQAIFGTAKYRMFEKMMMDDGERNELTVFNAKVLHRLVPFIQNEFDSSFNIGFDDRNYDPTVRFYAGDDLLGWIDLPNYAFFYTDIPEISKIKAKIKAQEDKIDRMHQYQKEIYEDYDYKNKEGLERAISYMVRKNNSVQANKEVADIDDQIKVIQKRIVKDRGTLADLIRKDGARLSKITEIQKFTEGTLMLKSILVDRKDVTE